ncbi:MAG TPA: histidine kinase [Oxalobacteraceae bacterium]|nr:histidine kinase [Oxalobacteraceae bacterium]HCN88170.1 histidine kinase [Oxalobacteraceae bacterium]
MDRLKAFSTIAVQAGRGELAFPTSVNTSLKIKRVLDDPDCSLEQAAKLLMTAPLIAARAVAMANSAAYNRAGAEITSARQAAMRLGFKTLRSLVAAEIVREFSCTIPEPEVRALARQLWEHTAHVAALAHLFARRVTHLDPETAMFAAIVHEIGGFYLLYRAHDFPGLLDGECESWQEFGQKAIGRRVLGQLSVPKTVTAAVEALWFGVHTRPPLTLGDTLLLAKELAPVTSPFRRPAAITGEHPAPLIDFEVGEETLQEILQDSSIEVASLTASLLA